MTDDVVTTLREIADRTEPPTPIDLGETVRRGRRRVRRRRVLQVTAGMAVAAATAVAALALLVWPGDQGPTIAPAPPADLVEVATEHLELLGSDPEPGDALPPGLEIDADLIESTVRAIPAPLSSAQYWVGVDVSGRLCLVGVILSDESGWAPSMCEQPPDFAMHGVWVAVSGPTHAHEAWLVPDDHQFDDEPAWIPEGPEWTLVAPNLAIRDVDLACQGPVTPMVLPDGSDPGEGEVSESDYGLAFTWGPFDDDARRVTQVRGDPLELADEVSDGLTVRGGEARLVTIGDPGQIAIWFRVGGCDYTILVGPGLTIDEARAYAESF